MEKYVKRHKPAFYKDEGYDVVYLRQSDVVAALQDIYAETQPRTPARKAVNAALRKAQA